MRLNKVTLNNFRCFEHLELDLHPRLTVLVGKNGAGKTAILDAIAVGLSPVLRYLSSANQRLSGVGIKDLDIRIEPWSKRGEQERWGACDYAQVIVETASGLSWDAWKPSAKGKQPKTKVGESELARAMASILDGFRSEQRELLPIFAYYGAQRGYIEIPQRLRAGNQNYDHPASALVDALDARSDFREMLKWFDLEESAELRANKGCRPEEYEESAALSAVRVAIEQVLGGDYSNPRFNREHKFVVDAEEGPTPLQVSQLSQGYQSMLALAMDFARRMAIGNGHLHRFFSLFHDESVEAFLEKLRELNPQWFDKPEGLDLPSFSTPTLLAPGIMLIDEVDLHLHPAWQQRVLDDLLRTFPSTQFIVTTHSPQVLSTVRRENIRTLGPDASGRIVASQPLARTYGEPSGDVLHSVMLVDPQPPVAEKPDLQHLTELVDQGRYDEPEALHLMQKLLTALGEQHPQLQRLQRSIQRQRALKG
ncbi:AAA family ATPase [Azotobacter chroococcum]|uniref:AAA family ATPase n=1 Tax=Azotobacter chroococcum TaxID=353 RepID=A0AA43Z5U9_9GAMM|nr:AAA family ATPase [Azotobacter chroococcum]NHN77205.1 AAA family ATPase [Azotobacter chroococcum]